MTNEHTQTAHQLHIAAGFLHHHGLYQVHVFGDFVLGGVYTDGGFEGFYLCADRCVDTSTRRSTEGRQCTAQQYHGQEDENACPAYKSGKGTYKSACGPDSNDSGLFRGGSCGFSRFTCFLGELFLAVKLHFPGGALHQGLAC